jgi:hypothetical protein
LPLVAMPVQRYVIEKALERIVQTTEGVISHSVLRQAIVGTRATADICS